MSAKTLRPSATRGNGPGRLTGALVRDGAGERPPLRPEVLQVQPTLTANVRLL